MLQRCLGILCLVWLTACGSTPVKDIRPQVEFKETDLGKGRSVFLTVSDSRALEDQNDLLQKGIVADDFSLALVLKREVRVALFNFGFLTAHDDEDASMGLRVDINELTHIASETPVMTNLYLRNQISLILNKPNVVHTFTYATERTHKLGLIPATDKSRALIAEIIADTLQRAFQDPAFLAELSSD